MERTLYLAYGSNMNQEQMKVRCPGAEPVGKGLLEDYQLLFRAGGKGVYLTVEPRLGYAVPVAVWSVSPADEAALDEYEVYPSLYSKEWVDVAFQEFATGQLQRGKGLLYVMTDGHPLAKPGKAYVEACLEGCRSFDLDQGPLLEAAKAVGVFEHES